jgi:outer membrane biosynthesis protein TonB
VASILAAGKTKDMTKALGHDSSDSYYFRCPICDKKCQCAVHRKKHEDEAAAKGDGGGGSSGGASVGGPSSAADLEKFAKEAGIPVSEVAGLMNDSATRNKGKPKPTAEVKKVQKPAPEKKPVTKKPTPKKDPAAPKEKISTTTKDKVPKENTKQKASKAKITPMDPSQTNTLKLVPVSGPPQPLIRKPKHVNDPDFEWIAISYPLNIISARL